MKTENRSLKVRILIRKSTKKVCIQIEVKTENLELGKHQEETHFKEEGKQGFLHEKELYKEPEAEYKGEDTGYNCKGRYTIRNSSKAHLLC